MADITRNEPHLRWHAFEDGREVGHLEGERDGDVVALVHTEVDPDQEGKGIAGQLVRTALDEIRAKGQKVRPLCPYVKSWIKRHPEYADLVVTGRA